MKPLTKTQVWTLSFVIVVMMGAMKAEEVKDEEKAQAQINYSIALAKKDKANDQREFKRLFAEAQSKTGFPGKEQFAVNP